VIVIVSLLPLCSQVSGNEVELKQAQDTLEKEREARRKSEEKLADLEADAERKRALRAEFDKQLQRLNPGQPVTTGRVPLDQGNVFIPGNFRVPKPG
jgi:hypothetical protein